MIRLREYQIRAVSDCIAGISSSKTRSRQIIQAPCGAGKTVIFTELCKYELGKGGRVLFLVDRISIINQTRQKLIDSGIDGSKIGIIQGKNRYSNIDAEIQVASIASVIRRNKVEGVTLIVADECHHSGSKQYRKLFEVYPRAHIVGLSATPMRSDKIGLSDIYDRIIATDTYENLFRDGYLIKPDYYVGKMDDLSGVKIIKNDYDPAALEDIVNTEVLVGNIVDQYKKHAMGLKTIFYGCSLDHSRIVAERFNAAGIRAVHLDSNFKHDERDQIERSWRNGDILVMCNFGLYIEGLDVPDLECIIDGNPTTSLVKHIQKGGRVSRVAKGKSRAVILDHARGVERHGVFYADRTYNLKGKKIVKTNSEASQICPHCFEVMPPNISKCQNCQKDMSITSKKPVQNRDIKDETEEELKLLTPEDMGMSCPSCFATRRMFIDSKYMSRLWCKPCRQSEKVINEVAAENAGYYDRRSEYYRLLRLQSRRGFASGFAKVNYKSIFGAWPPREWGDQII